MSSEKYIPPYKVSGKAMNLIAEIAAAIERYKRVAGPQREIDEVKGAHAGPSFRPRPSRALRRSRRSC